MNRSEIIKLWIEWFDNIVINVYKKNGKYIIDKIYDEIILIEKTYPINTDDEIDIYNKKIDIKMNKIYNIKNCISNTKFGDGINALFDVNLLSKENFIFLLNETNYPVNLFYENDNFNITNGFDLIYDDFLLNKLFKNNQDIKDHLITMRPLIIMNMNGK
jgi:hypothetical protein